MGKRKEHLYGKGCYDRQQSKWQWECKSPDGGSDKAIEGSPSPLFDDFFVLFCNIFIVDPRLWFCYADSRSEPWIYQFQLPLDNQLWRMHFQWLREGVKNTRVFYGQADRKGGAHRSHPDHKQMWECWPFFPLEYDSLMHKTHFISLWGGWKVHFSCPFHDYQLKL